jgi:hypothetical protein
MTPQDQPSQTPRANEVAPPGRPATGGGSGVRWAGGIVLALVLYVLSTGPALKLAKAGYLSQTTLNVVYAPIIWSRQTEVGEKFLRPAFLWYWETVWDIEARVEN